MTENKTERMADEIILKATKNNQSWDDCTHVASKDEFNKVNTPFVASNKSENNQICECGVLVKDHYDIPLECRGSAFKGCKKFVPKNNQKGSGFSVEELEKGCGRFAQSNFFSGKERCGTPNSLEDNGIFLCPECKSKLEQAKADRKRFLEILDSFSIFNLLSIDEAIKVLEELKTKLGGEDET